MAVSCNKTAQTAIERKGIRKRGERFYINPESEFNRGVQGKLPLKRKQYVGWF